MAGCATIGQSVINIKSGGHTRLSTLSAGVFLLWMLTDTAVFASRLLAAPQLKCYAVPISPFSYLDSFHKYFNWTFIFAKRF